MFRRSGRRGQQAWLPRRDPRAICRYRRAPFTRPRSGMLQQFASDNNAGLCPQALDALVRANGEPHAVGYGGDPWTERACEAMRRLFETDCEVFFVFSGTAA